DAAGPEDAAGDAAGPGGACPRDRHGERRGRGGQGDDDRGPGACLAGDKPRGPRPRGRRDAPGHGARRRKRVLEQRPGDGFQASRWDHGRSRGPRDQHAGAL
ncbi:MAG: Nucleoid-associated protein YaaK, partial [uncultured Rubrobacteraceae bacterium]